MTVACHDDGGTPPWRKRVLTVLLLFLFMHMGAATWTVYHGDSFTLTDANASIEWGQNYTWNASGFNTYSDTLQINMTGPLQDRNITPSSNTSAQFNTTFWRYNLSEPVHNQAAVKISGNATAGTNVTFQFTALPAITFGHYVLSGGRSKTYGYGHDGTVTWSNWDWSAENFTVQYQNDTAAPSISLSLSENAISEGADVTISCSASDPAGIRSNSLTVTDPGDDRTFHPGCGNAFTDTMETGEYTVSFSATDKAGNGKSKQRMLDVSSSGDSGPPRPPSAGHSWLLANNSTRFMWRNALPEAGIQTVTMETVEPRSDLSLSLRQLRDRPNGTDPVQHPYRFYEFETQGITDAAINHVNITVEVNRSFAQRFDRVMVSRYDGGWADLPTQRVDATGRIWTYRANASGFSYYAVHCETVTEELTRNQTADNRTANATEPAENVTQVGPVCGNQRCEQSETRASCPADCEQPGNATIPGDGEKQGKGVPLLPIAGVIGLIVVVVSGFLGYRRWRHHRVQSRLQNIAEQAVTVNLSDVDQHRVNRELNRAEQTLENRRYGELEERLDRIEKLLQRYL